MTPPYFLLGLTSSDWSNLGISAHRQLVMSDVEKIRLAGIDPIVRAVAGDAPSHMRAAIRHQLIDYLWEVEWDEATAITHRPAAIRDDAANPSDA